MKGNEIEKAKVILVSNDKGAKGMYIDGELVLTGQSIDLLDILSALQISYINLFYNKETMQKMGTEFPKKTKDLYIKHLEK